MSFLITARMTAPAQGAKILSNFSSKFSTSCSLGSKSVKLLIVGAGTGGCATAAKFTPKFGKGQVAIIEPNDTHFYQPMWTLVGAGLKPREKTARPTSSVLPKGCEWIKDRAVAFDPDRCTVTTANGTEVKYEYLVVTMGMQLHYDWVKGATEALESDPRVGSNYSFKYVGKTFEAMQRFNGGNAIFTFPNTPIKCAGAPQKIMYLADDYFRKHGKRESANIMFNTSLGVIFGVKKYAASLLEIVKDRNIQVNYRRNLVEVRPDTSEAIFADLDSTSGETHAFKYDLLHITPPMAAPDSLRESNLVDSTGYLDVDKHTLQHLKYPNIFGVGDCTSVPTAKTAAAVAGQMGILRRNLTAVMKGQNLKSQYDGYTSCPLITAKGKCILAEFGFDGVPMETFPFDQGKERTLTYLAKVYVMPEIYWKFLLNGYWEGPGIFRKAFHLGDRPRPAQASV